VGEKGLGLHYYQHHIGDFIKATARLTDSQTMAYLRLSRMYYDTEKPLKPDSKLLAFQIGATVEETELLLESFFWLADSGWHHTRCDQEIQDYHAFLEKKSNAGCVSAERRKHNSTTGVEQVLNDCSTDVQLTTNQQPLTNKPKRESQRGTRLAPYFALPDDGFLCRQQRPELDPREVFEGFRDYRKSQPGQKGVKTHLAPPAQLIRAQRQRKKPRQKPAKPQWRPLHAAWPFPSQPPNRFGRNRKPSRGGPCGTENVLL